MKLLLLATAIVYTRMGGMPSFTLVCCKWGSEQ